jgi:hypothetical protein
MKITESFVKKTKNKLFKVCLPESGRINFFIKIIDDFTGMYSFFCSTNAFYDPDLHVSLESSSAGWHIVLGRFCKEKNIWIHLKSNIDLLKDKEYSVEINYGKRNRIEIKNSSDDSVIEDENINFLHYGNKYIAFGDIKNLIDRKPIELNKFQLRELYNGKSTCIFNVQKPEILDSESSRAFI